MRIAWILSPSDTSQFRKFDDEFCGRLTTVVAAVSSGLPPCIARQRPSANAWMPVMYLLGGADSAMRTIRTGPWYMSVNWRSVLSST